MYEKQSSFAVLLNNGQQGRVLASTKYEAKQKAIVKYDDSKCKIK